MTACACNLWIFVHLQLFYADKENRHKNDPDFDRAELLEKCREQWRSMSDKKKVVWINWALEEEARYQVSLDRKTSERMRIAASGDIGL